MVTNIRRYKTQRRKRGGGGWELVPDGGQRTPDREKLSMGSDFITPYGEIDGQPVASRGDGSQAVDYARRITPELLDAERASGPIVDYNYQWYGYDDMANPTFDADRIRDAKTDFFYETYTLGAGRVPVEEIADRQMKAAALLAAEEQTGQQLFSKEERRSLQRLANIQTAPVEIDRIRDRRLKRGGLAKYRATTPKGERRKLTANEADGKQRLLEFRAA